MKTIKVGNKAFAKTAAFGNWKQKNITPSRAKYTRKEKHKRTDIE